MTPDANGELFVSTDTSGTRIADGGTWSSIRQIRVYVNDTGGSSFENILTNTTTDSKIRIQTTESDYGVFQVSTAASKTNDYYSIGFDDDSLLDSNGTYAIDTLSIALDIQVNGEIFIDGDVIVDGSITADKIVTSGITVTSNQVTGLGNLATDNTTLGNLASDNTTLGNFAEANNVNAGTDINAGSLPNSRLNANVSLLGNTGNLFTNTTNISGGQINTGQITGGTVDYNNTNDAWSGSGFYATTVVDGDLSGGAMFVGNSANQYMAFNGTNFEFNGPVNFSNQVNGAGALASLNAVNAENQVNALNAGNVSGLGNLASDNTTLGNLAGSNQAPNTPNLSLIHISEPTRPY